MSLVNANGKPLTGGGKPSAHLQTGTFAGCKCMICRPFLKRQSLLRTLIHADNHALLVLHIVDVALKLLIQDPAVGNHNDAVEHTSLFASCNVG